MICLRTKRLKRQEFESSLNGIQFQPLPFTANYTCRSSQDLVPSMYLGIGYVSGPFFLLKFNQYFITQRLKRSIIQSYRILTADSKWCMFHRCWPTRIRRRCSEVWCKWRRPYVPSSSGLASSCTLRFASHRARPGRARYGLGPHLHRSQYGSYHPYRRLLSHRDCGRRQWWT